MWCFLLIVELRHSSDYCYVIGEWQQRLLSACSVERSPLLCHCRLSMKAFCRDDDMDPFDMWPSPLCRVVAVATGVLKAPNAFLMATAETST
jgi:hypothetical protein